MIEANEAFAAQACAVAKDLGLRSGQGQPERVGHLAGPSDRRDRGHPGGEGLYELERIDGRYALVTMCIGGGQGIAAIFERVH